MGVKDRDIGSSTCIGMQSFKTRLLKCPRLLSVLSCMHIVLTVILSVS